MRAGRLGSVRLDPARSGSIRLDPARFGDPTPLT
jgi:hypothetical protein